MVKTYDELRASPPGTVCEHGLRERSCPHCESNAADQEIERLEARIAELERAYELGQIEVRRLRGHSASDRKRIAELEASREAVVAASNLQPYPDNDPYAKAVAAMAVKLERRKRQIRALEEALAQATGLPTPDYAAARSDAEAD